MDMAYHALNQSEVSCKMGELQQSYRQLRRALHLLDGIPFTSYYPIFMRNEQNKLNYRSLQNELNELLPVFKQKIDTLFAVRRTFENKENFTTIFNHSF